MLNTPFTHCALQSPGPELTLPDEFGVDWKREKVEQEMNDEEIREDRKKVNWFLADNLGVSCGIVFLRGCDCKHY